MNNLPDVQNRHWMYLGGIGYIIYVFCGAESPAVFWQKKFGIQCDVLVIMEKDIINWMYDKDQVIKFSEKMFEIISDPWKYYDDWTKEQKIFRDYHFEFLKIDINALSDDELKEKILEYYTKFTDQFTTNNILEPLSIYFQEKLETILIEEGYTAKEATDLIQFYSTPKYPNYIKQCVQKYNNRKDDSEIPEILYKYNYINNNFSGRFTFTKEDLETLVKEHKNEKVKDPELEITQKAKKLLNFLQMSSTMQDVRKAETLMAMGGFNMLFKEFARRNNYDYELIRYSTPKEIIEPDFDINKMKERTKLCVYYFNKNGLDIFANDDAEKIYNDFHKYVLKTDLKVNEIKGIGA